MTRAKAFFAMETVTEPPDDSIPQVEAEAPKLIKKQIVQRYDLIVSYVGTNLQAETSITFQAGNDFLEHTANPIDVAPQVRNGFVLLSNIVRWRRHYEIDELATWQSSK